ncbi:MAG: ATP-binding cassette domain-containing protein, partial [Spirochaetaceae bacterium]
CAYKGIKSLKINLNSKRREFFRDHLLALKMGLEDRLKDNVGLLSGGQRQALTLLMMVLSKPELILLDEHTAALDPHNAELVMELTSRFVQEYQLTTVMITHNMQQALQFGNRLIMMDAGEIIYDVSGEEKRQLTVAGLIEKFRAIRHQDINNDELLLS